MKNLQRIILASVLLGGVGNTLVSASPGTKPARAQAAAVRTAPPRNTGRSQDVEELLKSAFELYRQKKFDEALAACAQAAALRPDDFRPPALAGFIYMGQWKLKSASESFAKSISLKPDNKPLYLAKARADELRGAKEEAVATCRKALELDPSFAEAYVIIGDSLRHDADRRGEAIAAYQSAIKAKPRLPAPYESLGQLLADTKDEKGAEEAFRNALAADPKRTAGRFALGRLLVKQGRLKEARVLWEERTPGAAEDRTFPNFITVLERAERLQRATDALAQKPDDPETLLGMGAAVMEGDSWVSDRRQERAIAYFRKALELKPGFTPAQYAICKAYVQLADTFKEMNKNVDEELAKLRRLDPKLALEMENYRKTYSGGLKASDANLNQ